MKTYKVVQWATGVAGGEKEMVLGGEGAGGILGEFVIQECILDRFVACSTWANPKCQR